MGLLMTRTKFPGDRTVQLGLKVGCQQLAGEKDNNQVLPTTIPLRFPFPFKGAHSKSPRTLPASLAASFGHNERNLDSALTFPMAQ